MNRIPIILFVILIVYSCTQTQQSNTTSTIEEVEENEVDELAQRLINEEDRQKYELKLLADPETGRIPEGIYELEREWARNAPQKRFKVSNTYTSLGPNNLGGRTRALAFDVRDDDIMLAGGVSSGLFRSTDGGKSWTKVSPTNEIHNVTCVVQDPRSGHQNTWYYSTGEAIGNSASAGGTALFMGNGVYRSTNNGVTWSRLTSSNPSTLESFNERRDFIQRLAIDPTNGDIYMAAISTIYRSDNGGNTWSAVLFGSIANNGQVTDVMTTPAGRIYAAFAGTNDTSTDGVWTSVNGTSWNRIANSGSVSGWNTQNTYGRVVLGYAPSDSTQIYALYYDGTSSNCLGTAAPEAELFKAKNIGGNHIWTNLSSNLPDETGCSNGNDPFAVQGGYDLCVAVKPNDTNTVYIGGTNLYKSTDGFTTNSNTTRMGGYASASTYALYANHHPDIHIIAFKPSNNDTLFTGTDGGIHKTDATTSTTSWISLNNDYVTYQYYHVAIAPDTYKEYYIGGCQDNGTVRSYGSPEQSMIFGGDGCAVGIANDGTTYTEFVSTQRGNVYRRSPSQGLNARNAQLTPINNVSNRSQFVTYFHLDPDNNDLLYYANGDDLWRHTSASTATQLQSSGWDEMAGANNSIGNSDIETMATTRGPYNASTASLFIGTDGGEVFRLDDPKNAAVGASVADITPSGSSGVVSDIAVNPRNDDTIMVTYSNYGVTSMWWTGNANSSSPSWINFEGTSAFVPSARSCEILINDGVVEYYVGSSVGLYSTTTASTSTTWTQEGSSVVQYSVVRSLDLRPSDNALLVGTHGNGLFLANIGNAIVPDVAASGSDTKLLGPNEKVRFVNSSNEILAEVENLSSHNYGSTTLQFDNTGSGVVRFANNNPNDDAKKITEKSLRITPTTNNTSGNIRVTTYFTQAEASGWKTGTGNYFKNINQIKSSGAISSATVSNTIYGANTTVDSTYNGSDLCITSEYSNGFSGFAAGLDGANGPLPVDLIYFTGKPIETGVQLDWATAMELNSSHFEVQKFQSDEFQTIGLVQSSGNSNEVLTYQFLDETSLTPGKLYKYRLKMVDFDGSWKVSEVVSVKTEISERIALYPNPVKNKLYIQSNVFGYYDVKIYNLDGQVIKGVKEVKSNTYVALDNLKNGVYFVEVLRNRDVIETRKIIISR